MEPLIVAVPCYNEDRAIPALLEKFIDLREQSAGLFDLRVVVIDDASTDDSYLNAQYFSLRLPLRVLRHDENRGLSGALKTALKVFRDSLNAEEPPIAFAFMDGNDTHDPNYLRSMFDKLADGADVVIASRFKEPAAVHQQSLRRKILSFGASRLFSQLRPLPGVTDYSCSCRMFSPRIIRALYDRFDGKVIECATPACMIEVLLKCDAVGARFEEVPFRVDEERKINQSTVDLERTAFETLQLLLKKY